MSDLILPPETDLFRTFQKAATRKKLVFLAGLPGTGKSLLLQQLALLAEQNGRAVHLLQWDVSRLAFETPATLAKYPEIDGVTHAAIRKAVGLWARGAIVAWRKTHPGKRSILLGELPLIGNRLIELVQPLPDGAESLLRREETCFLVPVPSRKVRAAIEAARKRSSANPQHEKERKDAQPNVLAMLWRDLVRVGNRLGVTSDLARDPAYDPAVYSAVFTHLLQHRRMEILPVEEILQPTSSPYDLQTSGGELSASAAEAERLIAQVEHDFSPPALQKVVDSWYQL